MIDNLFIMAHPDDAAVFAGGIILNQAVLGKKSHVISVSGTKDSPLGVEMSKSCDILKCGFTMLGIEGLTFNRVSIEVIEELASAIIKHKPKRVITHWKYSTHPGHTDLSYAVDRAITRAKIVSLGSTPRELWYCDCYYSWGASPSGACAFNPDIFFDVTIVWDQKVSAIKAFTDWQEILLEMVEVMARLQGGRSGVKYSETLCRSATLASLQGGESAVLDFAL